MINFFKNHWLLILLATLAAFLLGLWTLRPFLGERIDESLPKLNKPEFEGVSLNPQTRIIFGPQTPQKVLSVLNMESKPPLTASQITHIAQPLGFFDDPLVEDDIISGTIYIWNNEGYSLSISPLANRIDYSLDFISNPPAGTGNFPSPQVAKENLLGFLEKLGISFPGIEFIQKERYLAVSGYELNEVSPVRASILELNLTPTLGETAIVTNSPDEYIIVADFNRSGNILSFQINNSFGAIKTGQEYHLKNLEDIKNSIHQEGKILQAEIERHGKTIEDVYITSIQLSQGSLAYFLPKAGEIFQPIYILQGTAFATGVQQFPVTIYLPAIKSEYFTIPELPQ
ncbi:hypothetical protein HYZ78_01825 [Candidatus Microgenomates bacterium]|nr:hypothetical protein [Candidatus Microgenomates bacterium]